MTEPYIFQTHSNEPCDVCDGMEGEYDYPPRVPVHDHCKCTVTQIPDAGAPAPEQAEDCNLEYRNINLWVETYIETKAVPYRNNEDTDVIYPVQITHGAVFDDIEFELAMELNWFPEFSNNELDVVLPAHTAGRIVAHVEFTQMVCAAELWQVCAEEDEIAGVITRERYVGPEGGMSLHVTNLVSAEVEETETPSGSEEEEGEGFFLNDGEIPT